MKEYDSARNFKRLLFMLQTISVIQDIGQSEKFGNKNILKCRVVFANRVHETERNVTSNLFVKYFRFNVDEQAISVVWNSYVRSVLEFHPKSRLLANKNKFN